MSMLRMSAVVSTMMPVYVMDRPKHRHHQHHSQHHSLQSPATPLAWLHHTNLLLGFTVLHIYNGILWIIQ
jgi:hypothetical protein